MKTHVYANGQEIACKAVGNDGVSPQAFPDPCWSPPGPTAGPVVIPYTNTCHAGSISNGTKTVFIAGQEVAIEDQSYFSSSIGNEAATQAFGKGVATGVITGKAYFTKWSFDVVFEGFGVPRHTDLVGHNHGSMPSNTPLFPYISRSIFGHDCSKEEKRIERACEPDSKASKTKKSLKKSSKLSMLLKAKSKRGESKKGTAHWTDDHCDGLHIALGSMEKAREYAKDMEEAFKSIPDELNMLGALESKLKDMAINAGTKAVAKWTAKAGAKQLAGSSVPAWGNAAMAIWSAADAAMAIGDVAEIKAVATESLEKLDVLRNKMTSLQSLAKDFENFGKLSPEEQEEKAQELATDGQDLLATLNNCTRARKCNLVPYKAEGAGNLKGQKGKSKVEPASKGGCCPGQTGHHLIPKSSIEDSCKGFYDHNTAPTVCVEGTSQNMGSHKRVHQALAERHKELAAKGKIAADGTMSMDEALNAAAKSHAEAFPLSRCSKKCIRAQLESYYRGCRNARPAMVNDQAKKTKPGKTRNTTTD